MITIIDCDIGNIGSIRNMLRKVGTDCHIATTEADIVGADKLILPGVGHFDHGMARINELGIAPAIRTAAMDLRRPLLGICLGMQLLTRGSEEGSLQGLGLVAADTVRFPPGAGNRPLKVPHMGWNRVQPRRGACLFEGADPDEMKFYFVHSYYVSCDHESDVAASTFYGVEFHSAVQSGNVFGVQFHPEKSHRHGMQLLRKFVEL